MPTSFNRRDFIKIGAAAGIGTAMVGPSLFRRHPTARTTYPRQQGDLIETSPTYCEICFWKCAGWVHSKNGKPWKVVGHPEDQHSHGRLCTRGTGGIGAYTDPERLKRPLIRVEERGEQVFREVSWDEALDYIAHKLSVIKETHGPESLAMFSHGTGASHWKTLTKAYGSACITAPSFAQCRGPRAAGFYLTYGDVVGSPERTDIANSRCMVLIGSHLGENLHNGQVQEMGTFLANGGEMIVVDPRFSTAAGKAKHWLPIKPSTDLALILAWIHVLIEEELYDRDYVERYTTGFEQLKEAVATNTPEWAYPITTIEPAVIRETARTMARYAPATLVHPGRHVTWYGDDTQRSRAIAILNALLGSWGREGGFYIPQTAQVPEYPHPEYPEPSWKMCEETQKIFPYALSPVASHIRDMTVAPPAPDKQVKAWLVYGSNLILSLPDIEKTIQAIQNLDLLVVIDIMPAEICGWADVVLPEATYLERYDDLRISPGRRPQIALRAPAFEPMYDTKPSGWIVKKLAAKMGLSQYFPWEDDEDYLDWRLRQIGSSLDEMLEIGVKTLPSQGPLYFPPGADVTFNTPSGMIELYSEQLEQYGFDPIPVYRAHQEPPAGYYRLIQGRSPFHTFARTTNNPILTELQDENTLWVHPTTAKDWGLETGQYVHLENQDGKHSTFPIRVQITERIRTDCVYMVHGFGHSQKQMSRSYGKGMDDNELVTNVDVDPIMGGTGRRSNFVTFKLENATPMEAA
ncbi:MAG: molybdopterin-dependent oxidoreductase [Bacteroidetes bacterium]|jgi:thiosulfate reductase/polysulfide reductase chain A|nr:molybdopterin-dependent oxidoreductase [Bacteroidota bacterium]